MVKKVGGFSAPDAMDLRGRSNNDSTDANFRDFRAIFRDFRAMFREFLYVFAMCFQFFQVSECVWIHSDPYGPTRMRWDASRCVRKRSNVFELFGQFCRIFGFGSRSRLCYIPAKPEMCALKPFSCCLLFVCCSTGKNQHRLRR